jgi:tetratricopeptide (TPR) repeat protein
MFTPKATNSFTKKFADGKATAKLTVKVIRLSEAYLNRAEANWNLGKYAEAAECIVPALGTLDSEPAKKHLSYLALSEQYDKLIERCNKIIKSNGCSELVVLARLLLATAYEEGKGVEQNLIQAFLATPHRQAADEIAARIPLPSKTMKACQKTG